MLSLNKECTILALAQSPLETSSTTSVFKFTALPL